MILIGKNTIFGRYINNFKNTGLYRVLTGDTKTAQVSKSAVNIVFDRELSSQIYSKIDSSKEFTIQKGNKRYTVRQLQTL